MLRNYEALFKKLRRTKMNDFDKSEFVILKNRYSNGVEKFHLVLGNPYCVDEYNIFEFDDLLFLKLKFCMKKVEVAYIFNPFIYYTNLKFETEFGEKIVSRLIGGDLIYKVFDDTMKFIFETHSKLLDGTYQLVRNDITNLWVFRKINK